jgi:hypothetical protein
LRSTLEQIITSGVFDDVTMRDQMEQLKGARIALSKEALAGTLLDQLRIGSQELVDIHAPRWLKKRADQLEIFLLDITIRREFMKPGGPIDRIVRFLSEGSSNALKTSEIPGFEEHDFDFSADIRRELRGYEAAQDLADRLQGEDGREKREELAQYLNHLLAYAIGHATALTSDDFKNIFYDLRRLLRKQGRRLALFIEDITALTGIDLGLLDVLATQHKGNENQDLCRVISVIGITNSYFVDHFPDHMKDRVTHSLTLNAATTTDSDTELLNNADATADMASRYLNVMRLNSSRIEQWFTEGGKLERIPNACDNCAVRSACHEAFGYQRVVTESGRNTDIGLYPFNKNALWEFYRNLQTSSSKRTPRAFLYNVLSYILQSHGNKVAQGQFPPAPVDLGGEFKTFVLNKYQQLGLINAQGKSDSERIKTLVMIWGDGTIDAEQREGKVFVGTLSPQVFIAFGITPIEGVRLSEPVASSYRAAPVQEGAASRRAEEIGFSARVAVASTKAVDVQRQNEKIDRYVEDITRWHDRKEPLQYYEEYNRLLVAVIRTYVRWELHGISNHQVDEMFKGFRKIYIEGQVGKVNAKHFITFRRSTELAMMLQALVEIKERNLNLESAMVGGHLANISIWLHQHEQEIVRFVRLPDGELKADVLSLTKMLLLSCLVMACLAGELKANYSSTEELMQDLIRFCVNMTDVVWAKHRKTAELRSDVWKSIVGKRLLSSQVSSLCSMLLGMLNCAQGDSPNVRFIDAATALSILDNFQRNDWQLPESGCIEDPQQKPWDRVVPIYTMLREHFELSLLEEQKKVQQLIEGIESHLDDSDPKETLQAMGQMVATLVASHRGTSFTIKQTFSATRLKTLLAELRSIAKERRKGRLALRLSAAIPQIVSAGEYLEYFTDFEKEATKQQQAALYRLSTLQAQVNPEIAEEQEKVRDLYQDIMAKLNELAGGEVSK